MSRDLGFSDRALGMGMGIFFISYVALQIPGALLVARWSARRMISATMIAWGSLTALTALVHTPHQLYFARFVLGAAEAGFFPGVRVYLSHCHSLRQTWRNSLVATLKKLRPRIFVKGAIVTARWIYPVRAADLLLPKSSAVPPLEIFRFRLPRSSVQPATHGELRSKNEIIYRHDARLFATGGVLRFAC